MSLSSAMAVLRTYRGLPPAELAHVMVRERTAPLEAVAARLPRRGRILDVGCGHGVLEAVVEPLPGRSVLGIDPDARKLRWASRALARRGDVSFEEATVEQLVARGERPFHAVVLCDVLYLVPREGWSAVLQSCRRLVEPGGAMVVKEAEADGSWRHHKTVAQELVMVRLLRRTAGATRSTFVSREEMCAALSGAGFSGVEVASVGGGYSTPHVLYVAR